MGSAARNKVKIGVAVSIGVKIRARIRDKTGVTVRNSEKNGVITTELFLQTTMS